ncbi:MAG: DUF3618 domain-containing protein, partial [Acidimicrobiales bacterium]
MGDDPDVIERRIAASRSRISATVDRLRASVDPMTRARDRLERGVAGPPGLELRAVW